MKQLYVILCALGVFAFGFAWLALNVPALAHASTSPDYFIARPDGATGTAIAYDVITHVPRSLFPQGIESADGKHYYTSVTRQNDTTVHELALSDAAILNIFSHEGKWTLRAVSANGGWLALTRNTERAEAEQDEWAANAPAPKNATDAAQTEIAVINTAQGKVTHQFTLNGKFSIDAITGGGKALFLIEHASAEHPEQYLIRLYDLTTNQMQDDALRAKTANPEDLMVGEAWGSVASSDGQFLHTLYLDTTKSKAFIHVLDLVNQFPLCIDLPSGGGDMETLKQYTLALSPDGKMLYAANPALGALAIVNVPERKLARVLQFPAQQNTSARGRASSMLTTDNARLYFTNGASVWKSDLKKENVTRVFENHNGILALGASADNSQLYTIDTRLWFETHEANTLDARANCPVTQPPLSAFVPPAPYPRMPPYGEFWYGAAKLWTLLNPGGRWTDLPEGYNGYVQKTVWWRPGYDGTREQQPALTVSGKQLDGSVSFVEKQATNAFHPDFGGWAMMSGVEIPKAGCWEITGEYGGAKTSFVIWVES